MTPQGENGFCIHIVQCGSLISLVQTAAESPSNYDYLLRSRCSGAGANVIACCPSTELQPIIDHIGDELLPSREICGQELSKSIYGGQITRIDEFPWTAQLWYINCKWILVICDVDEHPWIIIIESFSLESTDDCLRWNSYQCRSCGNGGTLCQFIDIR